MVSAILVLLGFLCICVMGWGFLSGLAGGMSDAPMEGRAMADAGLHTFIGGAVGLVVVIGIGIYRWYSA